MAHDRLHLDGSEAELFGDWSPCPSCGSVRRKAVATLAHRNIAFVCFGCGTNHLWIDDDGRTGQWIPHDLFWPGNKYENTVAQQYLGNPKSKSPERKYDINLRRIQWIHSEQASCAQCHRPPLRDWHNDRSAWFWIKEFHPDIYDKLVAFGRVRHPALTFTNWKLVLVQENIDLFVEVTGRVRDANLQADHSIPRAVLKELWPDMTGDMRKIATNTLAFGLCTPHNLGKHKVLLSRAELLARHIDLNHEGSERAAMADVRVWRSLSALLDLLDRYKSEYQRI